MSKYQGKEFTSVVQANTEGDLDGLVSGLEEFANSQGLERVEVLQRQPDPDGGWEAIIRAHNWNPISWAKGKFGKTTKEAPRQESSEPNSAPRKGPGLFGRVGDMFKREPKPTSAPIGALTAGKEPFLYTKSEPEKQYRGYSYEQDLRSKFERKASKGEEKLRGEKALLEEELRQEKAARAKRAGESASRTQAEKEGRFYSPSEEEMLESLPPELRKKYAKRYGQRVKEARKAQAEAAFEIWEEGVPTKKKVTRQEWAGEYYTDKATGKTVPRPVTKAEKATVDYHPAGYRFVESWADLSPAEQQLEAKASRAGKAKMEAVRAAEEEVLGGIKRKRLARKLAPVKALGEIGGNVGKYALGATVLGMAGVAQSMQPGAAGPQRASKMLAPKVPVSFLIPSPASFGNLEHLRKAVLPKMRARRKLGKEE